MDAAERHRNISIPALREEGDYIEDSWHWVLQNFYPRPPRGGRHDKVAKSYSGLFISIPALREEGDAVTVLMSA